MPDSDPYPSSCVVAVVDSRPLSLGHAGWEPVVAWIFRSEQEARHEAVGLASRPTSDDTSVDIHTLDLPDAMRALSRLGIGAMKWFGQRGGFVFATRIDEVGQDRPTLAVPVDDDGAMLGDPLVSAVGMLGTVLLAPTELARWSRYDLIDRAWLDYVDEDEPILGWRNGAPLWEIRKGTTAEMWFDRTSLLGPWSSPDGTLAFFTHPEYAKRYYEAHAGRFRVVFNPGAVDWDAEPALARVIDLRQHLAATPRPPVSIVINPGGPRGMSAIVLADREEPEVISVYGRSQLLDNNTLAPAEAFSGWRGFGTFHWNGGSEYLLLPLDVPLGGDPFLGFPAPPGELSDHELELAVQNVLRDGPNFKMNSSDVAPEHTFMMCLWDTVIGDRIIDTHRSFAEAIHAIASHEVRGDRQARANGAEGCWQIGFTGSSDEAGEYLGGEAIQAALARLLVRSARRGYRPSDADSLVALVNTTFATIHLDAAGFAGDLAWRLSGTDGQLEDVFSVEGAPFTVDQVEDWLAKMPAYHVEETDLADVRAILGASVDDLEEKSKLFLATALGDRKRKGMSPVADYAPVSIEITKALEVELNALLDVWSATVEVSPSVDDCDDANETLLRHYCARTGKPPSLGQHRHLLKSGHGSLHRAYNEFLDAVPGGRLLRRDKFRRELIKAADKYRNGGAHDSPIPLWTCEACVRDLIGEPGSRGAIALVVDAKVAARKQQEGRT